MNKIRILGLVPTEVLHTQMLQLVNERKEIDFTGFVCDPERALRIAQEEEKNGCDAILSYGIAAQMIREAVHIPLIEIETTPFDVLRSLQLAGDKSNCVLAGYPGLVKCAASLKDVLGYVPPAYTVGSADTARDAILRLIKTGDPLLICDGTVHRQAMSFGIRSIPVTPGRESISAALERVLELFRMIRSTLLNRKIIDMTLSESGNHVLLFDEAGTELFRSEGFPAGNTIPEKLRSSVERILGKTEKRFVLTVDGMQYDVIGERIAVGSACYAAFMLTPHSSRLSLERYGIKFRNAYSAQDEFYNSLFGISQSLTGSSYEKLARTGKPTMVIGEVGTGKTEMTTLLHNYGPYHNAPICIIDCTLLKDKGWNYLMYNENSPLFGSGITFHFRQISQMDETRFNVLFDLLHDTHIERRNQIIFCRRQFEAAEVEHRYVNLTEWFSCSVIRLKQLKENRSMIPQLANMYINSVNATEGSNIAGVEPSAMQLLQEYDWPANHDQFRRILRQVSVTSDGMIREEAIRSALEHEKKMYRQETPGEEIPLQTDGKTMDEIMIMAVQNALRKYNGNQTAAAAELGINRTSVWRMIQKYNLTAGKEP